MRVLVTGATGFVGVRVLRALADAGLDGRGHAHPDQEDAPADYFRAAVGPDADWTPALEGVDAVVHLAARAHVLKETESDPESVYFRINAEGTAALARQAARAGVKHFVFASTIGVCGESTPVDRPFTETDEPAPVRPYSRAKLAGEQALRAEFAGPGRTVTIFRPPLMYGPGVPGNFRTLLRIVRKRLPLPLAWVRNRRDFLFVDNFADSIRCALLSVAKAEGLFLAADGSTWSTPELLRTVGRLMDKPARLFPCPDLVLKAGAAVTGRSTAYRQLCGSLVVNGGRFAETFGWTPPYAPEDGLRAAVEALEARR